MPLDSILVEATPLPRPSVPSEFTNAHRLVAGAPSWPAGPVGPAAPVGPGSPWGPAEPVGPGSPWGPAEPEGPAAPVGPVSPLAPVLPLGPRGPTGPCWFQWIFLSGFGQTLLANAYLITPV